MNRQDEIAEFAQLLNSLCARYQVGLSITIQDNAKKDEPVKTGEVLPKDKPKK